MMTPEERVKHLEEYRAKDIEKVKALLIAAEMEETMESLATRIVDEIDPPLWRKR